MSDIDSTGNTMRERASGGRVETWLLMSANRRVIAALLLLLVFAALLALGALDGAALRRAMEASDPVETLFQGLVGAIITGVTLVVTISQLVLSQELGALGDQADRMENAMQFRRSVEEKIGVPAAPPEPAAFLKALVDTARDRAQALTDDADETRDGDAAEQVRDFAGDLAENARQVSGRLGDAQFGTFSVVSAALDFNYSWKIYEARRLEDKESLSEETRDALADLVEVLKFFGPAREHIKTLYFEWELTDLSRELIYLAVPALIVAIGTLLYLEAPPIIEGALLGIDHVVWITCVAAAVSVSPFMLLLSYVLRLVTVAKRTLAMGPFILRETNRSKDIDWDA